MNLITGNIAAEFTGALSHLFDSFARAREDRWIVINKEPIKNILVNEDAFAGYSTSSNVNNFDYVPVSGRYPAVIIYEYKTNNQNVFSEESKTVLAKTPSRIKVEKNAANFILNGKTINVIVDGQTFNVVSEYKVQDYLGLRYYYFDLSQTL